MDVPASEGGVGPGDSMSVSPTLTNSGTDPALAFIKFSYPVLPGSTAVLPTLGPQETAGVWLKRA